MTCYNDFGGLQSGLQAFEVLQETTVDEDLGLF